MLKRGGGITTKTGILKRLAPRQKTNIRLKGMIPTNNIRL